MKREEIMIVGLGEVGLALFDLFKEREKFKVHGFDVDKKKMLDTIGMVELPTKIDAMHVCYSCIDQKGFVQTTLKYIAKYKPKLTIIDSTVAPGTTQKIYEESRSLIVHSPIQGMHKSAETMKRDILFWPKYIGGTTKESAEAARRHFLKLGLKVRVLKGSAETELAKLFETTYRAWMITCFQEMHRISRRFGADFDEVLEMMENIHRTRLNKPLHFPGVIGGHCLIPNTKLLLESYNSEFLRLILESNEKRKKEVEDKNVANEIEKIRKRVNVLERELSKLLSEESIED